MPPTTSDASFEYEGDPITLVANTPLPDSAQVLDIPMFENFDPLNAVKHFRFKFHATQDVPEALYYFNIEFFNTAMQEAGSGWETHPIDVLDGWVGEAGESYGSGPEPENRTTIVSDHDHYGTAEGTFVPPYNVDVFAANDSGSFWTDEVIGKVTKNDRLPAGGDWFLRITLTEDSPGDVTLHDFSFEFTYQEFRPRNIIGPIPLTEGWTCSNTDPTPPGLYLILHHGVAYMYGEMLNWSNFNEETEEDWFTDFYTDATTKLVDVDGIPEEARPAANTIVPIRFYDFDRVATVLGEYWELSINTDGSITFVERTDQLPDKLRLGGGTYSFAPMQVRWPIEDQTHGPDTGPDTGVIWEVHGELLNEGESSGETWMEDHPIEITKHGGIAHLKGGVHHESTSLRSVPLWQLGGIVAFDSSSFAGVKILNETPGPGQDFSYIQLLSSESPAGPLIAFDASPSHGQEPLTYEWEFGDGDTGTGITPTHDFEIAGPYFVTLTVTDPRDRTDDVTKEVTIRSSGLWSANFNNIGAVINGAGTFVLFQSGNPDTQVFKGGDVTSGTIPNAPGSHFIGAEDISGSFFAEKNRLDGGIRQVGAEIRSVEMPLLTDSVVGRKFGTAICIQSDGSHYRHEVECTAIGGGGGFPNTYTHKLFKNVGGTDTQIGATVTNNNPSCSVSGRINFSDVEQVGWVPNNSLVAVNDSSVPKSGTWGYFVTGGVTVGFASVTGNQFPSYPDNDSIITFEAWWPVEYEFDEFTPDP